MLAGGEIAMSIGDDLVRACADLGLVLDCRCDRTQPKYQLTLDGDPGAPALQLTMHDDRDVNLRLLDADRERCKLLLEVSVKTVKREPSFDLWLEDTARERWLVAAEAGEWSLRRAAESETLG